MNRDPHAWITALRQSHDRLADIARRLDGSELRHGSYASKWTIAQVFSHLASQAEIGGNAVAAARRGEPPPGRDAMAPVWERWNNLAPEEQRDGYLSRYREYVERWESFSDDELDSFRITMFGMELDAPGMLRLPLGEHTAHSWDVRVALEPTAVLEATGVALLVDGVEFMVSRVGKPQGITARLAVATTEPERRFTLTITDAASIAPSQGEAVDGTLRLPAEALIRLIYGRLDPEHAPPIALDGPLTLDDLRAVFPGF